MSDPLKLEPLIVDTPPPDTPGEVFDPKSLQPPPLQALGPQRLEIGVDDLKGELPDTSGLAIEKAIQEGYTNITLGIPDAIAGIISSLFVQPLIHYDNLGKAISMTYAGTEEQKQKTLADNLLTMQAKVAARNGVYKFLNYEPVTDVGSTLQGWVMKPADWIGNVTKYVGTHMADAADSLITEVDGAIRAKGAQKPGGWTSEDEIVLAGATTKAKATVDTALRVAPDAALLWATLLRPASRSAEMTAAAKTLERLDKGLTKNVMPWENLQQLENFNKQPLTPVEKDSLINQMNNGQFSSDISIETVGGKPVRILTGEDTVRSLQMLQQEQGVRIRNVKVRYVEKAHYSPSELVMLDHLGKLGYADLLANERLLDAAGKAQSLSFKEKLVRSGLDASGNLKRSLLKEAGPKGAQAEQMLTLAYGGTPRASLLFGDLRKLVWGKLGRDNPGLGFSRIYTTRFTPGRKYSERELFDQFAHATRALEIAKVKPGKIKTTEKVVGAQIVKESKFTEFKLEGPITPSNAPGILHEIQRIVGDKRYAQFEERVNNLFDGMKLELDRMKDAGLIDETAYNKMKDLNYLTRRFSSAIDPVDVNASKRITVGDSGIPFLEHGTKNRAFITDTEAIVAEHIARVERRIARNDATRALAEVAKDGKVDWAKPFEGEKIPVGWKDVKYIEKGKVKKLILTDKMAAEWTYGDTGMSYALAEAARLFSGSTLVKSLATGYNPEFAFRNFLRDAQHLWKATGTEYSSFAPIYVGQLAVNIAHVWRDALLKTGVYRDYVMDGGGFETLTHQGHNLSVNLNEQMARVSQMGYRKSAFAERFANVKEMLALPGEFSELVTRLAIRDRVLMNQRAAGIPADPQAATYIARNYLDFSQGGTLAKAADTMIPYLNANIQAIRTGIRPYTRGGKLAAITAFKDLQLIGVKGMLQAYAWQQEPETMRMVSEDMLVSNFIMPLGMSMVDDDGVVKPLVLRFPIDSSVVPLTGPMDLLIKKYNTGENPSQTILDMMKAGNPIGAAPTIPIVQAFLGYASNYNMYTNDKIWKGTDVKPGAEFLESTPEFYKKLGQLFPNTVSPARLQYVERTLAPSNTYFYSAEWVSNLMLEEPDPVKAQQALEVEKYQMTQELLTKFPGLRRMVSVVEPAEAMTQIQRQALIESNTEMKLLHDDVEKAIKAVNTFGTKDPRGAKPYKALLETVKSRYADRPDVQEMATRNFMTQVATEAVWRKMIGPREMYFPTKQTWVGLAMTPPEDRAKVFYQMWRTKPTKEEKQKMFNMAAAIDSVAGRGTIISDRFMIEFNKRRAKFGDDPPLLLGGD